MESLPKTRFGNSNPRLADFLKHASLHFSLIFLGYLVFFYLGNRAFFDTPELHEIVIAMSSIYLGVITAMVFHEWFHLFGARLGGSTYSIPKRFGIFVFEWDFAKNDLKQFYIMSIAGSAGGLLAILFLGFSLTSTNFGYNLAIIAAFSAFVFAAAIEWPVIFRTCISNDPHGELAKTTPKVLALCLVISILSGATIAKISKPLFA